MHKIVGSDITLLLWSTMRLPGLCAVAGPLGETLLLLVIGVHLALSLLDFALLLLLHTEVSSKANPLLTVT